MKLSSKILNCLWLMTIISGFRQKVILGAFAGNQGFNMSEITEMEAWMGKKNAVITLFTDFCPGSIDLLFGTQLPNIYKNGNVPVISWMPIACPGVNNIFSLINSGAYDTYINTWIARLKTLIGTTKKAFIRFGHEMNGNWYTYSPAGPNSINTTQSFVDAWKKINLAFKAVGLKAPLVQFIFCPNNTDQGGFKMELFFPGVNYVDWFGIDGYNWGATATWSTWAMPIDIFDNMLTRLKALSSTKPIALSEYGTTSVVNSAGDKDPTKKGLWLTNLCTYVINKGIKMISYFNIDKETDWAVFNSSSGTALYNSKKVYKEYKACISQTTFISTVPNTI